jgi:chemotaxis protein MotB
MRQHIFLGAMLIPLVAAGCVSTATHTKTLEELAALRKSSAEELERATGQADALIKALEEDKAKLAHELSAEQAAGSRTRQALVASNENLDRALAAQRRLEEEAKKAEEEAQQSQVTSGELRRERDLLRIKSDDLERRLQTAQQESAAAAQAVDEANRQMASLEKEKATIAAALAEADNRGRDLTTKLEAEQSKVAALQQDKQRLMGGTTTAQEEIARLQKRAGELETEAARAKDLERRLSERDQLIGTLRQEAADRNVIAARAALLAEDQDKSKQRVAALTSELANLSEEASRLKQEREQLAVKLEQARHRLTTEEAEKARLAEYQEKSTQRVSALTSELAALGEEAARVKQEREQLAANLADARRRLEAEEAEKAGLEQERAAKEAEIQRLTKTHDDLAKSLQDEIAKGDIQLKQVRDRLTINMVDRVLFDSGQAQVKPAGLKVLKQVSDVLRKVADKQIRIEGHTDNVPIGVKLREKFATNWELSTARATSVVRYLIEEGGIDRAMISAGGYADTRPVDSNDTEGGKAANRRIEIVLYPKDLAEIVRSDR